MLNEILVETQKKFGIKSKDLCEEAGISRSHLSSFRQGKSDLSASVLWRIVEVLDRCAAKSGARRYFCDRLAGEKEAEARAPLQAESIVESLGEAEVRELLLAIADRIGLDEVILMGAEHIRRDRQSAPRKGSVRTVTPVL